MQRQKFGERVALRAQQDRKRLPANVSANIAGCRPLGSGPLAQLGPRQPLVPATRANFSTYSLVGTSFAATPELNILSCRTRLRLEPDEVGTGVGGRR